MGRDFSVIKDNVGNDVQDSSTTFASLIGRWVNRRYMSVLRKINWNYVNEDYQVTTVAGTKDYAMETNFKTVLYAYDTTNKIRLEQVELQDLMLDNPSTIGDQGSVSKFAIFNSDDGSTYMRLYQNPTDVIVIDLPYVAKATELSSDTDEPILGLEDLLEIGATADAWKYKRQFKKSSAMMVEYQMALDDFIWEQENQANLVHLFKPKPYSRETV